MARTFSGPRLRDARLAAGLSPEQLAVSIGRSVYSIHSYETGRIAPPLSVLSQISDALSVDVADLFTVSPPMSDALRKHIARTVEHWPDPPASLLDRLAILLRSGEHE